MKKWQWWVVGIVMGGGAAGTVTAALASEHVRKAEANAATADSIMRFRVDSAQAAAAASARAAFLADSARIAADSVAAIERARTSAAERELSRSASVRNARATASFDSLPEEVKRIAGPVVAAKDSVIADLGAARDSARAVAASERLRAERAEAVIPLLRATVFAKDSVIAAQASVIETQKVAISEYDKAVHPKLGARLLGDVKPFLVGVGVGYGLYGLLNSGSSKVASTQSSYGALQLAVRIAR